MTNIMNPTYNALNDLYLAATIVNGTYTDLLFFSDEAERDAWAKGYNPSLGSYNSDMAENREVVSPDEYRYLFLGLNEDNIKRMIANASPDANNASARVYRINAEAAAVTKVLEEYSIATYSDDGYKVDILFFPDDHSRADWLDGEGLLDGEDLTVWHECVMPIMASECAMFFFGMNGAEIQEMIASAEPHEHLDSVRCINMCIDAPEMLHNIAIGQKLNSFYYAYHSTECPDIAFFSDEKSRNTWVNADPVARAPINEITDYIWLLKPGKILEAIMNSESDADGIHWIKFD